MTEYYKGYPAKVREYQSTDKRRGFLGCLPFWLAAGATTLMVVYTFESPLDAVLLLIVGSLFLWFTKMLVQTVTEDESIARIVPYFAERLDELECYGHGYAVARDCEKLDRLADRIGTRRLSSFGFNDDIRGETLTWHPANVGLESVTDLLEHLGQLPATGHSEVTQGSDLADVTADLRRFESALRRAAERDLKFCLVLLADTGTSGQEHDIREGSFF